MISLARYYKGYSIPRTVVARGPVTESIFVAVLVSGAGRAIPISRPRIVVHTSILTRLHRNPEAGSRLVEIRGSMSGHDTDALRKYGWCY